MKRFLAVILCLAWLAACTNTQTPKQRLDTTAIADTSGSGQNNIKLIKPLKPSGSTTDEVNRVQAIQAMLDYGTAEGGKPGSIRDSSNSRVVVGFYLSRRNIDTLLAQQGVQGITIRFGKPVDPNQHQPRTYTMYYYGETNPGSFTLSQSTLTGKVYDYVPPIR